MVTICWAAKGGSGTTVVAASMALSSTQPSLLVDLDGEVPAVLGLTAPDRPGVADWLASDASPDQLAELLVDVVRDIHLLPWSAGRVDGWRSRPDLGTDERWDHLAQWLRSWTATRSGIAVVDAGTGTPPRAITSVAERSLLVTRPCYLAVQRAIGSGVRPTGVILVDEPGRGLARADIERALGVPVDATVTVDPAVARAVDAGLLTARLPRVLTRSLRRAAA